jgi:hypothetical protein
MPMRFLVKETIKENESVIYILVLPNNRDEAHIGTKNLYSCANIDQKRRKVSFKQKFFDKIFLPLSRLKKYFCDLCFI